MSSGRALVMGLGLFGGGAGAARRLAYEGWDVTVTDLAAKSTLAPTLAALHDVDLRYVLGRHDSDDFRACDLVVANPAVPWDHELLQLARAGGARVTSEIELFCERCRGPILGITGTAGKTTTSRLLAAILEASGVPVRLGGNVGISLLGEVDDITAATPVVLELSSFQLERLTPQRRFAGAAILPITPNHLDRHADFDEYATAKVRLVDDLADGAPLVIDAECGVAAGWRDAGRLARLDVRRVDDAAVALVPEPARLLGTFNRRNLAMATTLARAFDAALDEDAVRRTARDFAALPDRLEPIAEKDGVLFVNDSKATTPETAAAAIAALGAGRIHLIAGGHDKGLDPESLVDAAVACRSVCVIGATGAALAESIRRRGGEVTVAVELARAVEFASTAARSGEVVLLSPGHASFDQFPNYAERGRAFRDIISRIEGIRSK